MIEFIVGIISLYPREALIAVFLLFAVGAIRAALEVERYSS